MQYTDFFKRINEGIPQIILVSGSEIYIRDQAVKAVRKALALPFPELNETILEAPDAQTLMQACETLPMMAERRLVLTREFPLLGKGRVGGEAEQSEAFLQWIKNAPESCCLLILQNDLDGRKKVAQALKKEAVWLECAPMKEYDLCQWLGREAARNGKKLENASYLVFRAGKDMQMLEGQVRQLVDYVGERETILRADIDTLIAPNLEHSVFEITDALLAGKTATAFEAVHTLVAAGQNRVGLLAVLTSQMRQLFHATSIMAAKGSMDVLSEKLKVHGYGLTMLKKRAARVKPEAARLCYMRCVDTDYAIKSGSASDQDAFFRLLQEISLLLRR